MSSSRSNCRRRCHRNGAALIWPRGEALRCLRREHQVERQRAALEADQYIKAGDLNPVARTYVREAFHAASMTQRSLESQLVPPP